MTLISVLLLPCAGSVAKEIEVKRVPFAAGKSSTTLKGSLAGHKAIDYRLGAKAGQTITVTLKTNNTANYFNLIAPGEKDVAFPLPATTSRARCLRTVTTRCGCI